VAPLKLAVFLYSIRKVGKNTNRNLRREKQMKSRRFFSLALVLSFCLAIVISGCAPARRPAEENRVVVPEVTKVFVETQELKNAPPEIRDLAKRFSKGEEAHIAIEVDGDVWIFVRNEDQDEILEVREAVRRVINEDTTILEIRLKETEQDKDGDNDNDDDEIEALVARLSVDSLNGGVVFYLEEDDDKEKTEKQTNPQETTQNTRETVGKENAAAKAPEKSPTTEKETGTFQVEQPKPDEAIQSPLKVSGQARVANSPVTMRLRDSKGNILAETETVANSNGKFSASLSFTKPADSSAGRLEVFAPNAPGGSSANTKVIPITFK
jgi:hypothetical protein